MQLKLRPRKAGKKSEIVQSRREGLVPAVIYKQGEAGEPVLVEEVAFQTLLRHLKPGHLPTTQIELCSENGAIRRCILKEIQYHPTTYAILHLDFLELVPGTPIHVKVPIEHTGVAECVGVKLGGILRPVLRTVRVECTPEHLPSSFSVCVKEVAINQSRRVRDLEMPKGVRCLDDADQVVVVVAKR